MALLVFATTWFYVRNVPLGQPPDEWAHLSYVADITSGGPPIPDYANSPVLNSAQQNYLEHPPLYYTALGAIGKSLSWDPLKDYRHYRVISALMVAFGVYLWVLAAMQLGFSAIQAMGLTGATLAIPMFPYLAGSINNDNLCYLGVALFFHGFLLLPSRTRRGAYICALGLLTTLLTKATGALFLLAFLGIWSCLGLGSVRSLFGEKHVRIAAALVAIACMGYYLPTFAIYHSFFPVPGALYQEHAAPTHTTGFLEYLGEFVIRMFERLPVVLGAQGFRPVPKDLFPLFYLMLGIPLAAWLLFRPFSPPNPRRRMADAFLLALLVTVGAQLWVCWQGYLRTGLYAGLQPRYYGYALPGLFLFTFADGLDTRIKRMLLFIYLAIAIVFIAIIPPRASVEHYVRQRQEVAARLRAPDLTTAPRDTLETSTPPAGAGFVDQIHLAGHKAQLTGWAIDAISRQPTRALWVSIRQHLIGTAQPTSERPDVAAAIGSDGALRSGFVITVSNVPEDLSPCDITVRAEQSDGTLATLTYPACIPSATNAASPPKTTSRQHE